MHEFNETLPKSPVEGVIYVIKRGDNYLLTKRIKEGSNFKDDFLFPGGKIEESDEDVYAAAKREIKEERGFDVGNLKYIGKVSYPHPNGFIISQHVLVVEESEYSGDVGNLEPEKEELYWVSLDEADRLCTTVAGKTVLEHIKKFEKFT